MKTIGTIIYLAFIILVAWAKHTDDL